MPLRYRINCPVHWSERADGESKGAAAVAATHLPISATSGLSKTEFTVSAQNRRMARPSARFPQLWALSLSLSSCASNGKCVVGPRASFFPVNNHSYSPLRWKCVHLPLAGRTQIALNNIQHLLAHGAHFCFHLSSHSCHL